LAKSEFSKFLLPFLVTVSFFGLAIVPLLLLQPNLQADPSPFRRPVVSTLYSMVSILGVVAVFYPNKCRLMFKKPTVSSTNSKSSAAQIQFKGHHPDCERFSANRITIRNSIFCAACSGLLAGAIAALAGIFLFCLGFFSLEKANLWVLAIGEVLMLVGLAQIKLNGFVKMVVNALFVVGSSISLIVADLVGQSLLVDAYVLGLIIFILWFRIFLSEWNNKRNCVACGRCV